MYEEGHRGFAFKSIILKLLLIFVIIFLIIWLFPTKNYVKNLIDQRLGTGSDQIFTNNVNTMKDAATSYFSGDRLPKKEGVSKTITLKEMLDEKLLIDLVDSNRKKCDTKKSYATITKNKSDYSLQVNLVCSDKKASINSYISDNSFCTDTVCSKKKLESNSKEEKQANEEEKKTNNEISQTKECEYTKTNGGYWSNYGAWSDWSTAQVTASNSRQVETKIDKIEVGTIVEQQGTTKHTQEPKKVIVTKNGKKYVVYVCPSDFDNGGTYNNYLTCVKTVPNYVKKLTYKNTVFYRYRDRHYVNSTADTKWSKCDNNELLNSGYKATGNTR